MKIKKKVSFFAIISFLIFGGVLLSGPFAFATASTDCASNAGTCTSTLTGCTGGATIDSSATGCSTVSQVCCKPPAATTPAATTPAAATANGSYSYTPMEAIPGFGTPTDFPTYVSDIYKFGLWTIGISALLMIMIGGYMYLTSAGNASQTGKAKGVIADAIIGLLMALTSWLLLYTINPDLVNLPTPATSNGTSSNSNTAANNAAAGAGNGSCAPAANGDCSVASLQNTCFGSNASQASSICNAESKGTSSSLSTSDITSDGNVFSVGLFQINLTVNDINGMGCPSAFSGKNYSATVVNKPLYDQCIAAAQDPATNIATACKIGKNGSNWQPWSTNKTCGF